MEKINLCPIDLGKCVIALVAVCEVIGIEYPKKLKPMKLPIYVQLANNVAEYLCVPIHADNSLETLGKTVQAVIDASISQGKASLSEIERVYNEKLAELK